MKKVLVPLADGFEEMEGIIIIDILRRAGIKVITASLKPGEVKASRGTRHLADAFLPDVQDEDYDMVVLPGGGPGAKNLEADPVLKKILEKMNLNKKSIAAICAAPNVLRNQGIIKDDDLYTQYPNIVDGGAGGAYSSKRVVRTRNITTSVGPGSAFEFSLDLVEQLLGHEAEKKVRDPLYLPEEIK
ncbi:MAG: DJ-1/PfpI family protein [Spirochaetia bacterium]|nr:DJ-1/PfpI family protein [Spirochaetia bacterium]